MVESVAEALRGIPDLVALLPGGIYPSLAYPVTAIERTQTPLAFDDARELLACGLVIDGGTIPSGPRALRDAAQSVIEFVVWQREGRDIIDAALSLARRGLVGERVALAEGAMVGFRFGGYLGPWRDEPLRAQQGRLRLLTARRLG